MVKVEIVKGDISRVEADALVNAANNRLWMGAGVAGALKRAGGPQIEIDAERQAPIKIGEVAVTGAGRLKARYIFHAAVVGQDLTPTTISIRDATRNSLLKAQELRIKTIVFPALGTGVGRFPVPECARVMLQEVKNFVFKEPVLERVIFILHEDKDYQTFQDERKRIKL